MKNGIDINHAGVMVIGADVVEPRFDEQTAADRPDCQYCGTDQGYFHLASHEFYCTMTVPTMRGWIEHVK
jgi:hypothetical protein